MGNGSLSKILRPCYNLASAARQDAYVQSGGDNG
jgi:hypothetical protein